MSDQAKLQKRLEIIGDNLDGNLVKEIVLQMSRLDGEALRTEATDLSAAGRALHEAVSGTSKWPKTHTGTGPLQGVQETAEAPPQEVKA